MPMKDGFKTLIGFQNFVVGTNLVEVTVKPPGLDGRGPIDFTSMRNNQLTTMWPKQLKTVTEASGTCQYDPNVITQLFAGVVQVNQLCSVRFPNTQTLNFYGWLDKFDPQENREGEVPLANYTVVPSNVNGLGAEVFPVLVG